MSLSLFVSYSHEDADLVGPVVRLPRATDDFVFLDNDSIRPGRLWREEIGTALAAAKLVVVFWCMHSSQSNEVRKEYQTAIGAARDILPVLLDETPVPDDLGRFQWIDFRHLAGDRHRPHVPPANIAPRARARLFIGIGLAAAAAILLTVSTWSPTRSAPPVHTLARAPSASAIADEHGTVDFSVTLSPGTSADAIEWTVDGEPVAAARGQTTWKFSPGATPNADHKVDLRVADAAAPQTRTWTVRVEAAGQPVRVEIAAPTAVPTPWAEGEASAAYPWGLLAIVTAALFGCNALLGRWLLRRRAERLDREMLDALEPQVDRPANRSPTSAMAVALVQELRRRAAPPGPA